MKRPVLRALMAIALMTTPTALYAEVASSPIRLSGYVPTICRVNFSAPVAANDGGRVDFGTMVQLCNNMEGYRLVMHHPRALAGGSFVIDGASIPLSETEETVIVDSNLPTFKLSSASLLLGKTDADLTSVSFRVEPKGTIY